MRKYFFIAILISAILLSGCGNVSLTVSETAAEITEVTEDVVHMNNCGGKADSKQSVSRSKSVQIEGGGELGVDGQVVNGKVLAKYSQVNEISKSLEIIAPPGTDMEFTIKWVEKTWVGIVTAQGKSGQANYKVSVPISVELVSSNDIGCPFAPLALTESTPRSNRPIAVAVGVTDQTAFSKKDANNYPVTAWVSTVDEAIAELSKYYAANEIVYVVHVPDLRVTPGNPGSCKLYLNQVKDLQQYPLGWIIGGEHIVPDIYKTDLSFCYGVVQPTDDLVAKLYAIGYSSNDLAVKLAVKNCPDCQLEFISSLSQLPDDWYHYTHNVASQTANLQDGCRTKQELIDLAVIFMITNNCPFAEMILTFLNFLPAECKQWPINQGVPGCGSAIWIAV